MYESPTQGALDEQDILDAQHQRLHQSIHGRESELNDPELRAALAIELAFDMSIRREIVDAFLDALDDPDSEPFETRKTLRLLPAVE